ncbi:MAG: DUF1624 domain-containing protein [Acidobacteriota bacterium]|nr:DUF1624 domain-containing protein [Acidobacteriota bacterium]
MLTKATLSRIRRTVRPQTSEGPLAAPAAAPRTLAADSPFEPHRVAAFPAASSSRVLFVDLARACAVVFMIQGHTLNVLLAPEYATGAFFSSWLFLRGLTSRLFLVLAGFAFTVATSRHWEANRRLSARSWKRIRRFSFFVLLGYSMRFPVRHLRDLQFLGPAHWQYFLTVDILQCIGVGLLLLQLLVFLSKTRRRYAYAAAALCALVVVLTPMAEAGQWTAHTPMTLGAYLSTAGGSLFPFLPWGAYLLLGAALGGLYADWGAARPRVFQARVLLAGGLAAIATGLLLQTWHLGPFSRADFWSTSPNLFLVTGGSALVLLSGFAHAGQRLRRLPPVLQALAQESLVIYFIHVCILYGSGWNPSLRALIGSHLGPIGTGAWIVVLVASMALVAWSWNRLKREYAWAATLTRLTAAAWVAYSIA